MTSLSYKTYNYINRFQIPKGVIFRHFSKNIKRKLGKSYYFRTSEIPLFNSTIGEALNLAADENGDSTVWIFRKQNIRKKFSEFKKEVDQLASGLIALGLEQRDRIAIWSPNTYEWVLTQFAAAKAGLILLTLNPAFQAVEVEYCLNKSQCKTLIAAETFKTQNYYKILIDVAPEIANSKPGKLTLSRIPSLQHVIIANENPLPGSFTFNSIREAGDSESTKKLAEIENRLQFDDPIMILFTSGTTGNPKGALLSHFNLLNNSNYIGRNLNFHKEKANICCQVPLFHCYGCVGGTLTSVVHQGTCVFPALGFEPESSLETIEAEKCTVLYGTPTMHIDLMQQFNKKRTDVSSLKTVVTGGSVCTSEAVKTMRDVLGVKAIANLYGMTESSPVVAAYGVGELNEKQYTVGRPIDHIQVKIIDENGRIVSPGTMGELCVRGHNVFLGYWDDSEKTNLVLDSGNWYHSGDLAIMDEDGYISIVGRVKDMIIRGGENIYPTEIENFLLTHPDIIEAQIVGVPDMRMGEELCAWIHVKKNTNLTEEGIKNFCTGKISHFKIPRYILFVEDFPKTLSGKIQKYKIREKSIKYFQLQDTKFVVM